MSYSHSLRDLPMGGAKWSSSILLVSYPAANLFVYRTCGRARLRTDVRQGNYSVDFRSARPHNCSFRDAYLNFRLSRCAASGEQRLAGVFLMAACSPDSPVVLVVEDQVLVRMTAHDLLTDAGFHVIEAANGEEA